MTLTLNDFNDAKERILESYYKQGDALAAQGEYDEAMNAFWLAGYYNDATSRIKEVNILKVKSRVVITASSHSGHSCALFSKLIPSSQLRNIQLMS